LAGYRYYQDRITELDREIQQLMKAVRDSTGMQEEVPKRTKRTKYQRQVNDPAFDLRRELYRIARVDLRLLCQLSDRQIEEVFRSARVAQMVPCRIRKTDIPGVSTLTAQVILTEIGPDVSPFRNASAFASWLGLCPEMRVSGGKLLSCKTRKVKSRAAIALRLGAHSLCRAKDYLGEFFQRMRAKLGTAQATTRHRSQNGANHLPRPPDQDALQRNHLSRVRRTGARACRKSIAEKGCRAGLPAYP
jgi:transposase